MSKFRKKPIVVEATRWFRNGDHPLDYVSDKPGIEQGQMVTFTGSYRRAMKWEGEVVRYFRAPGIPSLEKCEHCGKTMHEHGWIDTVQGGHTVCPGDWIITELDGKWYYPCKASVFEATYEPVEE